MNINLKKNILEITNLGIYSLEKENLEQAKLIKLIIFSL